MLTVEATEIFICWHVLTVERLVLFLTRFFLEDFYRVMTVRVKTIKVCLSFFFVFSVWSIDKWGWWFCQLEIKKLEFNFIQFWFNAQLIFRSLEIFILILIEYFFIFSDTLSLISISTNFDLIFSLSLNFYQYLPLKNKHLNKFYFFE